MGILGKFSKHHKELDGMLQEVDNYRSNNYKDAAQQSFQAFLDKYEAYKADNTLNDKQISYYEEIKEEYEKKLKGFRHV